MHTDTLTGRYNLELFEVQHGDNRYLALSIFVLFSIQSHNKMLQNDTVQKYKKTVRETLFLMH